MLRLAILLIVVLVSSAGSARAQLFLEEGKEVLAVSSGERVSKSITISNTSKDPVTLKVYWEDFQYQPPFDGTKAFTPAGTGKSSASQWVSYSPQEFSLPAFGKQKIDYTINAPALMDKGYYGVLFFERTGESVKDATGLTIVTRVGCLFFIEPKDVVKKAEITNIKLEHNSIAGNFFNKSDVILIPRMIYYIMDEGGMVKDRGEVKKIYVPAGATANWSVGLPDQLAQGKYSFILNADLGDQNVLVKELEIVKDPSGQLTIMNIRD